MSNQGYTKNKAYLVLKYGSVERALDVWLNADINGTELDGIDMLVFFLSMPPKGKDNEPD